MGRCRAHRDFYCPGGRIDVQKALMFAALLALSMQTKTLASDTANKSEFKIPGETYKQSYQVDKLNRNKKSEVTIFLPDSAMPDATTVIFWFHGCNGYSKGTFQRRLDRQLARLDSLGHSYALVIPELYWSKNTKTRCGRQARSFRKPGALVNFVDNSISIINKLFVSVGKERMQNPQIAFFGHSAGGSVFKASALSGDLCKIKPDYVVWSDSTYGNWFNSAWNNCLNQGHSDVIVLIRKWTATWKNFKRFPLRLKPPEFLKIKYYHGKIYHKTIGDNALEYSEIFPEGC